MEAPPAWKAPSKDVVIALWFRRNSSHPLRRLNAEEAVICALSLFPAGACWELINSSPRSNPAYLRPLAISLLLYLRMLRHLRIFPSHIRSGASIPSTSSALINCLRAIDVIAISRACLAGFDSDRMRCFS